MTREEFATLYPNTYEKIEEMRKETPNLHYLLTIDLPEEFNESGEYKIGRYQRNGNKNFIVSRIRSCIVSQLEECGVDHNLSELDIDYMSATIAQTIIKMYRKNAIVTRTSYYVDMPFFTIENLYVADKTLIMYIYAPVNHTIKDYKEYKDHHFIPFDQEMCNIIDSRRTGMEPDEYSSTISELTIDGCIGTKVAAALASEALISRIWKEYDRERLDLDFDIVKIINFETLTIDVIRELIKECKANDLFSFNTIDGKKVSCDLIGRGRVSITAITVILNSIKNSDGKIVVFDDGSDGHLILINAAYTNYEELADMIWHLNLTGDNDYDDEDDDDYDEDDFDDDED